MPGSQAGVETNAADVALQCVVESHPNKVCLGVKRWWQNSATITAERRGRDVVFLRLGSKKVFEGRGEGVIVLGGALLLVCTKVTE